MDCRSIVQIAKLRASVSFLCAWCSCEANSDLRTPGQRRLSGDCVALKMGTSSDIRKKGKAQFLVSREDITPQCFMVANKPLGDIHHTSAAFLCRIFGYLGCWILSTGGSASRNQQGTLSQLHRRYIHIDSQHNWSSKNKGILINRPYYDGD